MDQPKESMTMNAVTTPQRRRTTSAVRTGRPGYIPSSITFNVDSQLIEGYLQTENILVDGPSQTPAPLNVYLNANGQSEALAIQNSSLFHVCREPLSDSG